MLQQQRLQLGRGHAEALVFDQLLFAVGDRHVSCFVAPANISRIEPSIAQRFCRRFGRLPVALHDLRPRNDQLALLAHPQFSLAGLDIYDLLLRVVNGQANRLNLDEPPVIDRV